MPSSPIIPIQVGSRTIKLPSKSLELLKMICQGYPFWLGRSKPIRILKKHGYLSDDGQLVSGIRGDVMDHFGLMPLWRQHPICRSQSEFEIWAALDSCTDRQVRLLSLRLDKHQDLNWTSKQELLRTKRLFEGCAGDISPKPLLATLWPRWLHANPGRLKDPEIIVSSVTWTPKFVPQAETISGMPEDIKRRFDNLSDPAAKACVDRYIAMWPSHRDKNDLWDEVADYIWSVQFEEQCA